MLRTRLSLPSLAICCCLAAMLPLAAPFTAPFTAPLQAQMHRVEKAEPVTRAVAVYEYAGDLQKPTAARLIPVSLYIGGEYEDAGTYLARPIPFAIENGTIYELQRGGEPLGTLDLAYAKNLRGSSAELTVPFDQAWFGYGRFQAPKVAAPKSAKAAGHTQAAYEVKDDGKPHFGGKGTTPAEGRSPKPDPRDTTDVDPSADRAEKVTLPDDRDPDAPNADRPTLRRRPQDTTGGPKQKKQKETASVTSTPFDPDKDPDRPRIKRKAEGESYDDGIPPDPAEVSSAQSQRGAAGTVSAAAGATANGVLTDGSRPELRRNTAGNASAPAVTQAATPPELAKVEKPGTTGAPIADLHFAVAVSDPKNRPVHDFRTPFASDADRLAALSELRALATEVLRNPAKATDAIAFGTAGKATAAGPDASQASAAQRGTVRATRTGAATHGRTTRQAASATRAAKAAVPASTFADEEIAAYTLSYSAPLTYVYTAHTTATPQQYVTVVAQRNGDGKLDVSLRSVTDAAHLDRVPRYRLVDAVDADASNRADLLFELRGVGARQFALYRFLGPRPDEVFVTGTTK